MTVWADVAEDPAGALPQGRIGLVHDWLNQRGGAEDVLEELVNLFPGTPVHTSLYWPEAMPDDYRTWDIRPAFTNHLPGIWRNHQAYLPVYPLAFERMDLSDYDLVLSNKSGFCHGVRTRPDAVHICYCLTPTRFLWQYQQYTEQEQLPGAVRAFLPPFLAYLRRWDRRAADGVDHFIAISQEVRRRIAQVYGREAVIIYPPVDTERYALAGRVDDYYLMLGRLVPYRRIDLLIAAFNRLGRPLVIAGDGRDRQRLEALAGPTITFLGYVPDDDVPDLLARCRAFLFPGEEDFGIAPIQAMAAGRPVIAYAAGGALDTIVPGTGVHFSEQSVEAIMAAVRDFEPDDCNSVFIRRHARRFDRSVFRRQLLAFLHAHVPATV